MDALEGIWRLVESRAWDGDAPLSAPYGANPMGQIMFANGRMLSALCNGDAAPTVQGGRNYSSYGGPYTFDGTKLETTVDVASDPARIGGTQVRTVERRGERIVLRPPTRDYAGQTQRRELVWERVWKPDE
jgi:hypothetical protein